MLARLSVSLAAMLAVVGAAQAADLPARKAPPPAYVAPVPVFTWTGFYLGLNAGAAIRQNQWGYNYWAVPVGFPTYGWVNSNGNNVGFTGGGQIGYNWQMGAFVLGLEADLNYIAGKNVGPSWLQWSGGDSGGLLGTVRGRAGFALDRWLIYATGGFAYGRAQSAGWYPYGFGVGVAPYYWGTTNSGFKIGYTVGGGVEWAFADNWSIKAEYLFTDIRRDDNYSGAVYWMRPTQNHIVRAGINYHFNWGGAAPVVARY